MRLPLALIAALGLLLCSASAQAGTLTSATWIGAFQGMPYTLTTGGGSLVASGSSTGAGASVAITVTPQSFSTVNVGPPQNTITQTLGGSQTISITANGAAANQGVAGVVNVFLFVGVPLLFLSVPISIGVSGSSVISTSNPLVGAVNVTATFGAWTPGSTMITGLFATTTTPNGATQMTVPLPNFTAAGSVNLTAGGAGTITIVSPAITVVCAGGPAGACDGSVQSHRTAGATSLVLSFVVPEPGTAGLLLGAALVGIVALGRRRWR